MVCEQLEPKIVFAFFEEICQIPHGSGNTKQISDYCVDFAKRRGLRYVQDEENNVIIFKPGTPGYEDKEPVIIQGHMDMVCEKESGRDIDFARDGLELYVEGDFLKARGTTLGGDDGIALAYALAVLDSADLAHPPLEAVFTVDEEVGMLGADSIDLSMLKGRQLLNIDSEEEGIFLASCAGGLRADCTLPVTREAVEGCRYEIMLHGLMGGHSGGEIQKGRANAIVEMGRVLKNMADEMDIQVERLQGGLMDNAIPREVTAVVFVGKEDAGKAADFVEKMQKIMKAEYRMTDPDLALSGRNLGFGSGQALDFRSMGKILLYLRSIPWGVQHMSFEIPGLVETSLNPGILKLEEDCLQLCFSIRSSVTSRKYELTDRVCLLTGFLGGETAISGDYPAWEYREDSRLREQMAGCYRNLFGKEPQTQAIHAGLECGIFSEKIPGLDCISFGPDMQDIHTPKERLSISSTQRVWKLLVEFLKRA